MGLGLQLPRDRTEKVNLIRKSTEKRNMHDAVFDADHTTGLRTKVNSTA